jgi:NodT family efflux transporter outer membrane factor (OMF) lipoprotein
MIGGRMIGGSMIGGRMIGGSMIGGRMIGGRMIGGRMIGGRMIGGRMIGGRIALASVIGIAAAVSGCMAGPDYHRPAVPVAAKYRELPGWLPASPADAAPKGDWWTEFQDPLLDELEPMVAVSNQTVRQAFANYQQALAEVRVADSQLFPTIGISASASRTRASASGIAGRSSVINTAALEGTAGWTPDLWGAVRRLIQENAALAQADEATLANATLSEQTLLASTVIELRLADAEIDLEKKTVDAYRDSLRIVEQQATTGITATPPSAVITARVALETAQANLLSLGVGRAQYTHAIAVLAGKNPEDLQIPQSTLTPALPTVPAGVPSTLLERRPDIAAAERSMAAANAAVGIAVASYYPTIALSAAAGFSQSPLNGLLHAANEVWSLGASGTETVIDFGERSGEIAAAKAAYAAAVANYREVVLTAFEDVENDLSGLRILADQAQAIDIAVKDAVRGSEIALAEFEAGTVDYTTVAAAQITQLADQQSQLSVEESRLLDTVALISDLGGGWSDAELHDPQHPTRPRPAAPPSTGQ